MRHLWTSPAIRLLDWFDDKDSHIRKVIKVVVQRRAVLSSELECAIQHWAEVGPTSGVMVDPDVECVSDGSPDMASNKI